MRTFDDLRLLGDQVLVRCLGTADKQGSIHIPASAQEGRKIHQSGGDYLHRGEVVLVGPGDKMIWFSCNDCQARQQVIADKLFPYDHERQSATVVSGKVKCAACGSRSVDIWDRGDSTAIPTRAEMHVSVGDTILYESRRDAKLQARRFPSLGGLDEDQYVILHEEQHVLAVIE